ncbi:MAG: bifunctional hydroxymethylpyrimidine kinase/phosphomethylpyrimidine kinase [Actinomycetota bacterium]
MPRALSVAGSDSGGGAGIQADLKTFEALGVFGMTAITAVTVQNTLGVQSYHAVPAEVVAAQIDAVASDIGVDAAKTGMLADAAIVEAVGEALRRNGIARLVVDPVGASSRGQPLLDAEALTLVRSLLLPMALVVTPNLPEAAELSGRPVATRDDMAEAARAIHALGPRFVLVKGGHLDESEEAADLLFDGVREIWISGPRLAARSTHGTGCVLAAAITAELARGGEVEEAVRRAKEFVRGAIAGGLSLGRGIGPVDPAWHTRGLGLPD